MSIRFSKALKELNIGLGTAVEYLSKKTSLGEVVSDLNFKLSDEQYNALVQNFKQDADVHNAAGKIFAQKKEKVKEAREEKERERAAQAARAEELLKPKQEFKVVGKLEKPAKPEPEPIKPEPIVEPEEVKPELEPEPAKQEPEPEPEPVEEPATPEAEPETKTE